MFFWLWVLETATFLAGSKSRGCPPSQNKQFSYIYPFCCIHFPTSQLAYNNRHPFSSTIHHKADLVVSSLASYTIFSAPWSRSFSEPPSSLDCSSFSWQMVLVGRAQGSTSVTVWVLSASCSIALGSSTRTFLCPCREDWGCVSATTWAVWVPQL